MHPHQPPLALATHGGVPKGLRAASPSRIEKLLVPELGSSYRPIDSTPAAAGRGGAERRAWATGKQAGGAGGSLTWCIAVHYEET